MENEPATPDPEPHSSIPRIGEANARKIRDAADLSSVGYFFVFAVLIGAGIGYALDRWFGSSPWFFLIFFFLGLAAGMLNAFKMVFNIWR